MRLSSKYALHRFLGEVENLVEAEELSISVSSDFTEYRKVRSLQEDRQQLAPMFDAKMGFIPSNTGFCIYCRNKEGEIVHTQAIRMHDLGEDSLYSHIQEARLLYVPPEVHDRDDYEIQMCNSAKSMTGRVSYHGDAWIHPKHRMSKLNLVLGRYGLVAAKLFWGANSYFAFMSNENVIRGLHTRAGFFHSTPSVWKHGEAILCRYWLVSLGSEDIDSMIEISPSEISERKSRPRAA